MSGDEVRLGDALRLAAGTLTVLPVPPPRRVDPRVGGWAMALAPLVAVPLAAAAGAVAWAASATGGADPAGDPARALLAAVLGVAVLAWLTRGLHLDGLADTADGLGSGKPAEAALDLMRRGDVGPFGVTALVLTLLTQVTALAVLLGDAAAGPGGTGAGIALLAVAVLAGRLVLPVACLRGVPAARADGLGRTVAGAVSPGQAGLAVLLSAALGAGAVLLGTLPAGLAVAGETLAAALLAATAGVGAGVLLRRRCVRRLGGVTGDVLGACVEVTFTVTLVAAAVLGAG